MSKFDKLGSSAKNILVMMFTSIIYSAIILLIYVGLSKVFPSNLDNKELTISTFISATIVLSVFIMFIRDVFRNVSKQVKLIALAGVLIISLIVSWIISGYFINVGVYFSTSLVMVITLSILKHIIGRLRARRKR